MSSDQQPLSAFQTGAESPEKEDEDTPEEMPEQPQWSPGGSASTNNECDGCGAHVTPQFRRAYEDDDGLLHGCPTCLTGHEIRNGLATDPGRDLGHQYEAGAYAHAVNGGEL